MTDFLAGAWGNDCLPVVERRCPQVADALRWLERFTRPRLTGTGSCVFGVFATEHEALGVLAQLPERYAGFVSRGVDRSPVLALAGL